MPRITTASLDTRLEVLELHFTTHEAKLDLLVETVANLALILAGNVQEPSVSQVSPEPVVQEPKAKTDHQKMGEQNEARGLMYTARYACRDCDPVKQTGFYKLASAEGHAQRKSHKIGTLTFDLS
jgi:hypothetical protein